MSSFNRELTVSRVGWELQKTLKTNGNNWILNRE